MCSTDYSWLSEILLQYDIVICLTAVFWLERPVIVAMFYLAWFLFWRPISNFPDGRAAPRHKYIVCFSAKLQEHSLRNFTWTSPNFTRVKKCKIWPRFSTTVDFGFSEVRWFRYTDKSEYSKTCTASKDDWREYRLGHFAHPFPNFYREGVKCEVSDTSIYRNWMKWTEIYQIKNGNMN